MTAPVGQVPEAGGEGRSRQAPSSKDIAAQLMADPTLADGSLAPTRGLKGFTGGASAFPIAMLFAFAFFETMDRAVGQVLLPDIRDSFGLSDSGILAVTAVGALSGLVLTIPISVLADRGNRVRIMLIGAFIFSMFSIGTGFIPAYWILLVIMRSGAGVGQATVFPTHNSLISDYYDIPFRPRVFSLHRGAEGLGLFIGFLLVGFIGSRFASDVGWRVSYVVITIPCVLLIPFALRLKEPSRGHFERKAMGASADVIDLEEPPPSFEEAWRMVMRIDSLRRIFYALPFLAIALIGFGSLANLFYSDVFLLEPQARGLIEAVSEAGQLIGLVASAYVGTKLVRRDPALVVRFIFVISIVAAVMAAGFAWSPTVLVSVICRIGISASLAAILPSVFAALSLAIPARARASGFSLAVLYVIPGLAVLPVVGWISDNLGVRWGMTTMVPLFVVGGYIASTAHKGLDRDIRNVWTSTATRSELIDERRKGNIKQLLIRDLDVGYGDVQILFGVNFEVDQGEIVALLGTNGAGKSTLLRAITGVVEANNGAVVFDGRDITHAPPNEIAAFGIAMVPGGQGVFPSLTVEENLKVASWIERRRARKDDTISVAAKIDSVLETFPILASRLDEPAANLSGGQQQMLALGMAFLSEPKLLLIDELSLGLAPVVVEQLLGIVRAIRDQGTTIILVEQSVNVALTLANTAYFMEKGEIRFHGATSELLDRPDVLRSVFLEGAQQGMSVSGSGARVSGNGAEGAPAAGSDAGTPNGGDQQVQAPATGFSETRAAPDAPESEDAPAERRGGLEVTNLSVRFGGIRAVDDVSLSVAPGEIVGIIGPNGAGKTTMFDLISGFTKNDEGRVVIGGRDVSRKSPDARARLGLGRSFQDARLFPALTVEETIAVALDRWIDVKDPLNAIFRLPAQQDSEHQMHGRVDELIELMGIESFRSKFVRELSTGSRRVVDIACVLAHHPSVVLLDEPSSGIAQREAEALGPLILRIRDTLGASVLVIEHDMPLVKTVSDRIVALDQGHVVTIGEPDEVLNHPEVVASYLGNTDAVIARSGSRGD